MRTSRLFDDMVSSLLLNLLEILLNWDFLELLKVFLNQSEILFLLVFFWKVKDVDESISNHILNFAPGQ